MCDGVCVCVCLCYGEGVMVCVCDGDTLPPQDHELCYGSSPHRFTPSLITSLTTTPLTALTVNGNCNHNNNLPHPNGKRSHDLATKDDDATVHNSPERLV